MLNILSKLKKLLQKEIKETSDLNPLLKDVDEELLKEESETTNKKFDKAKLQDHLLAIFDPTSINISGANNNATAAAGNKLLPAKPYEKSFLLNNSTANFNFTQRLQQEETERVRKDTLSRAS